VILLKTGDVVPADCIIVRCFDFMCDESSLTGEAEGVRKEIATLENA